MVQGQQNNKGYEHTLDKEGEGHNIIRSNKDSDDGESSKEIVTK